MLTFVDGEENEVDKINDSLGLNELNIFLNEVFDGYLHKAIACEHRTYS